MGVELGIDAAQTALLCGIFWRLGGFHCSLVALQDRVSKLENLIGQIKSATS